MLNQLYCDVLSCQHNQSKLCDLNRIKVDGPSAHASSGTCCASFDERRITATNSHMTENYGETAEPETHIDCDATNCTYNEDRKCFAEEVEVGCCNSEPKVMSETECNTFILR